MAKQLLGNLKELFSPFFALKDHAHGLITKDGTISGQASKNVVTDSNGKITTEAKPTIPSANATATNIKMNGTQSAGSLTTFAKADHVHPVDTSRAAAVHTHDDRYYTETEVNTKLSDYLTTDDASATYQPKGSYLTSHNPVDTALSSTSTNAVQNKVINTALSGKANSSHTHTKSQITDFPTIPTKTSQLTNDSGYLTEHQSLTNYVQTNDSRLSDTRNPKSNKITASSSSIQDLNTYITTGFYYSPLNTEAQYIIHCPNSNGTATPYSANKAFFLLVEDWGSNNYTKQTLTYYDTNKTYTRIRNGGTWGNWTELTKDTNTTYSADNSTLQLSSTTFSVKDGGITNAKLADKSSLITEYIVGTQASSTSAWTGKATKITSLATGQVIYYKLPYASTSTAVTLNLTLADGSTTGAKEVWFWNGGRMTTQYGVNSVIGLIYNGTQWWAINPSSSNNNDYLRLATRIINGDENQIPANRIIGGVSDSNGVGKYYIVTSGKVLDIRYPILFNNSAINSGGYTDNVYISHTGVPLTNNVSGKTVTTQRQVYIEGTAYSNNKLTVSPNVFVSDDNLTNGYYYLYIGVSYSTTHIRFNAMNQIVYKKTSNGLIPVGQSYNDLTDKPSTFPPSSHTHTKSQITDFPTSMTPTAHTNSGTTATYGQATTSVWGHTKLSSATNSTDETMSATPKAVKAAYDLANGKPSLGTTATTAAKGDHTHTADTIGMVDDGSNIIQYYGVMDVQSMLDMLHGDKPSYEDLDSYSLNGHSHSYSSITNKPSYTATVTSSTSGAYKIGSINISGSNVDIYGKDTNTTYSAATQSANGLMSSGDKQKVDKSMSIGFGTIGGTTSAMIVSITGVTLTHGTIIACYNAVGANAANATLKVNNETAKPIYYNASAIPASRFPNKSTALLMYNTSIVSTGCWQMIYSYDSNNTYTAASATPSVDSGSGTVGTSAKYAREDHVHPTDTSRAAVSDLSTVATSGSYNDLINKPTIPTKTSQLTNDSNYIKTSSTSGYIKNDGTIGTPTNTTYGADRGISNVSGKFGHSNASVTAQTTSALKKIKYDTYGHITGTDNVSSTDIANLGVKITDTVYTHPASHATTMIVEPNALDNIGTSAAIAQANVNAAINTKIGELLENKILIAKVLSDTTPNIAADNATNRTFNVPELPDEYSWVFIPTKCNYGNISNSELNTDTNILTVRVANHASTSHGVSYAGILVYYHDSLKL